MTSKALKQLKIVSKSLQRLPVTTKSKLERDRDMDTIHIRDKNTSAMDEMESFGNNKSELRENTVYEEIENADDKNEFENMQELIGMMNKHIQI